MNTAADIIKDSVCMSLRDDAYSTFGMIFSSLFGVSPRRWVSSNIGNADPFAACCAHAVADAKANGSPYAVVFRDIAYPRPDAPARLDEVLGSLPENAGVVVLGCSELRPTSLGGLTESFELCSGCLAMMVLPKAYDNWLSIYEQDPGAAVDSYISSSLWKGCGCTVAVAGQPLFIEFNSPWDNVGSKSIGYVFNGRRLAPPDPFRHVDDVIGYSHYLTAAFKYSYCISHAVKNKSRCLIVGSNKCICMYDLKDEVDSFDGDVIRINGLPSEEYSGNYGSRTDYVVLYAHKKNKPRCYCAPVLQTIIEELSRNVFLRSGIDGRPFEDPANTHPKKYLSTGLVAVLLASSLYDEVNVLGFVEPPGVDFPGAYKTAYGCRASWQNIPHVTRFEHIMLKKLHYENNNIHVWEYTHGYARTIQYIVHLHCGLGNQMFQYAFGRILEHRYGIKVKYDIEPVAHTDIVNMAAELFTRAKLQTVRKKDVENIPVITENVGFRGLFDNYALPDAAYFEGVYQDKTYFKYLRSIDNELRDELTLPELPMQDASIQRKLAVINQCENSVFVHIRRGDYLNRGWCLSMKYYATAMDHIRSVVDSPTFFIFGEDTHFINKNFHGKDIVVCDSSPVFWHDMALMGMCRHAVLSNSTFAWWSAWLGRPHDNVVVVPEWGIVHNGIRLDPTYYNWRKVAADNSTVLPPRSVDD